jgi:hypothetical protein
MLGLSELLEQLLELFDAVLGHLGCRACLLTIMRTPEGQPEAALDQLSTLLHQAAGRAAERMQDEADLL